jgi:5'-methylthioadenosine phosphorylase
MTPPGPGETVLGFIGGSGLYEIDGLENARWVSVSTPWGKPSDELLIGELAGVKAVFLPRHGRGHMQTPTTVNYRANIDALKRVGVTDVISMSACGSFREALAPGTFVLVDQFIDRTFAREKSFFGPGLVAHVSMAHPVCPRLVDALEASAKELGLTVKRGGTYLAMEGPQFSSLAESMLYRSWGCDVIGMTNMPEAKLAREAELPYATVAMVTDYDCWHPDHDHVDVAAVVKVLTGNADKARALAQAVAPRLGPARTLSPLGIETALDTAIITAPEKRDRVFMRGRARARHSPETPRRLALKEPRHGNRQHPRRHPDHPRLPQERDHVP